MLEISNINPSKAALEDIVSNIVNPVIEGYDSPLKVATSLDFIIKVCDQAKAQIKPEIISEIARDPLRKEWYGYKVEVGEVGVSYDYSNCNDFKLYELSKKLEEIQSLIKERQNFLRAIKEHAVIVDEETGNVNTVYPPVKRSSTSPKFTLK